MGSAVMIAVCIGIVATVMWWVAAQRAKRVAGLKELAARSGFAYSERDASGVTAYTGRFRLFTHGYSHRYQDFLLRTQGDRRVCVFQFSYVTGTGKSRTTHSQTVALVVSPKMNLPSFLLEPENLLHKIGEVFGYGDIDFPDSPGFSSKFLLKGDDLERITALFDPQVRAYFERNLGWSVEGMGDSLIAHRHSRLWPVEEIPDLVRNGERIAEMFGG